MAVAAGGRGHVDGRARPIALVTGLRDRQHEDMRTWGIVFITAALVTTAGDARANHPCLSDGIVPATSPGPAGAATVPVNCPLEFYVGDNLPRPLAVYRNGAEVTGFPFTDVDTLEVTRDRSVCSSVDAACWTWIRDSRGMAVVSYTPGTPFPVGDVVGLGLPGTGPFATITIGAPDTCPTREAFAYEMCADPLGGPGSCTGGPFTCDGDGGVDLDGGLACDGGFWSADAAAASGSDGGGCSTGGGGAGALVIALGALGALAARGRGRRVKVVA
jgi:hypothetical protein